MDSSTGNEVTEKGAGGNYIKIAYTKTACFDTANTNVSAIYIDGVPAYTVKLIPENILLRNNFGKEWQCAKRS